MLLTDALIPGAWGWWPTWTWYLPLTILPLPFILPRIWAKSGHAARQHADEQIARIAAALEAEVIDRADRASDRTAPDRADRASDRTPPGD